MPSSLTRWLIFALDHFPSILLEVIFEHRVGPLSESETSEDHHRVIVDNAGVLFPSDWEIGFVILSSLWLDQLPLILVKV